MKDIYMISYSVKGIKNLDKLVTLSFYKKTITKTPDTQEYNIKGIYGMNGSGKSGLITSVEILRKLLTDSGYLNNPIAQKNLDAIVNKKTGELFIETEYLLEINDELLKFRYDITLLKSTSGKYVITHESLSFKKATSKREDMDILFEVFHGEVVRLYEKEKSNLAKEIEALDEKNTQVSNFIKENESKISSLRTSEDFKEKVYKTVIPRNIKLSEAPSAGICIFDYDGSSVGAQAYKELAKEVLSRNG